MATIGITLVLAGCGLPRREPPPPVTPPAEIPPAEAAPLSVTASSVERGDSAFSPSNVLDGNIATRWSSDFSDPQWLQVDLGAPFELSGVELRWETAYAGAYEVLTSLDGTDWATVHETDKGGGGTEEIAFGKRAARFVKIVGKRRATEFGYSLTEVILKGADGRPLPEASLPSVRRYYEIASRRAPGCYPRWLSGEQAFWTVVGVADDDKESIFCEDGTIEHHKRGFTLMPLVFANGKLISRDQAKVSQSLEDRYLPVPSVHWRNPDGVQMDITMFADGPVGASSMYTRYTIRNDGAAPAAGRLFLALRPFQLYPPWQGEGEGENEDEGKGLGGMARVRSVRRTADGVEVNGKYRIFLQTAPDGFGTQAGAPALRAPYRDPLVDGLLEGRIPEGGDAEDPGGMVSAVLAYDFDLAPGASKDVFVAMPLHAAPPQVQPADFQKTLEDVAAFWRSMIPAVELDIPDPDFVETLKAQVGYTFVTKDGPALQPGTWCYDKAWIRDGSIAAIALLQLGFTNEPRAFFDWYTAHQYDTGEIPCVIDNKAKNPFWEGISEYDSQGQYVRGVLEYYLFTRDRAFLEARLTNVVRALQFAEALRAKRLTPEYSRDPDKALLRGLISKSYANHNYSDNLWTLCGWRGGARIARILGREDMARWCEQNYRSLRESVMSSMDGAMRKHGIDFIPEYPEGKHFWPASIAFGVAYCDEAASMPADALRRTFELTWEQLEEWRKPGAEYRFTPEEMPIAETFLYLGWRDRALDYLRFMLAHRKPVAWMQWPEVVNSDERKPTIFGDMPHTWVGAQYINAVRRLFVHEDGDALILAAGVDPAWLESGKPVAVRNMPTHFGRVSYEITKVGEVVIVRVTGPAASPRGFIFPSPLAAPIAEAAVNGAPVSVLPGNRISFPALPTEVVFRYRAP